MGETTAPEKKRSVNRIESVKCCLVMSVPTRKECRVSNQHQNGLGYNSSRKH